MARILSLSSLYETQPFDCGPMREFVNAVVRVQPLLAPSELLQRLQELERDLGRRSGHNEPRVIDIDIITLGRLRIDTETLQVPHPRYNERRFVLVPLAEIKPDFICPGDGLTVQQMIDELVPEGSVVRISGRLTPPSKAQVPHVQQT